MLKGGKEMIHPLFICHGGPTLVTNNNEYINFLKKLGDTIKPKEIVVFSAHYESEITSISSISDNYDMIYDFYGFPEDILVIGSGTTVHNLSTLNWTANNIEPWALEFDNWLIEELESNNIEALFSYRKLAPFAKQAIPREEHLVPLFISMGSSHSQNKPKLLHRSYEYGTLSYICFQF